MELFFFSAFSSLDLVTHLSSTKEKKKETFSIHLPFLFPYQTCTLHGANTNTSLSRPSFPFNPRLTPRISRTHNTLYTMGLSAGNHHRRRSSVLTGHTQNVRSQPSASERRDDSLRPPGDSSAGARWDEQEPLTAEDTDASDLSSSAVETRELAEMSSDDDHYDEETGLTASQKRQRRRRRRQRRKLDARIADTKSSQFAIFQLGLADRNVLRKLLVNAGLILMWYFFSLSISIVSTLCGIVIMSVQHQTNHLISFFYSITNGCSPRAMSSFLFLFSLPVYIWPSNSVWLPSYFGSSLHYDLNTHQRPSPTPPSKD